MKRNIRSALRALEAFLVTLIMGGTAALAQSADEQRDWEHAQAIGNTNDYMRFILHYPSSVFLQDATSRLNKLIEAKAAERAAFGSHTYRKGGASGRDKGGGADAGY